MRTAIVGVGNLLMKDEGIGIHVAHALQKMPLPSDVEVLDCGTSIDTGFLVEEFDRLIVIDAVQGGAAPGTIYRFSLDDIEHEQLPLLSVHGLGLDQALRAAGRGECPEEIIIIGVEPGVIGWGVEPTLELRGRIPAIVETVLQSVDPGGEDAHN